MRSTLSLLLIFIIGLFVGCGAEEVDQGVAEQLLADMEPYLEEKYGPVNEDAYLEFFGGYRDGKKVQPIIEYPHPTIPHDNPWAYYSLKYSEREQQFLAKWFDMNDEQMQNIDKMLAGGRFGKVGIVGIGDNLQIGENLTDVFASQAYTHSIITRGKWEMLEGRPIEANAWFERVGRLGNALFNGRDSLNTLMGISHLQIARYGFETAIWSDLSPEAARDALERLNSLLAAMPENTLRDFRRYELLSNATTTGDNLNAVMYYEIIRQLPDFLLQAGQSDGHDYKIENKALRNHMIRLSRKSDSQILKPLIQRTMSPALTKRMRADIASEPSFQEVIGLSSDELAQLPDAAMLLLAPRYFSANYTTDMDARMGVMIDKMQQLRISLAARLYREETGRDPESLYDLVPRFLPEMPEFAFGNFTFMIFDDYELLWHILTKKTISLNMNPSIHFGPGSVMRQKDNGGAELSITLNITGTVTSKELENLEAALRSFDMMIESVEWQDVDQLVSRAQYLWQKKLIIHFRPNLKPLFIVSPGQSRESIMTKELLAIYDPRYGASSSGAIFTLVHF